MASRQALSIMTAILTGYIGLYYSGVLITLDKFRIFELSLNQVILTAILSITIAYIIGSSNAGLKASVKESSEYINEIIGIDKTQSMETHYTKKAKKSANEVWSNVKQNIKGRVFSRVINI